MFLAFPRPVLFGHPKLSFSPRAGKYCSSFILQPVYLGLSQNVFKPQPFYRNDWSSHRNQRFWWGPHIPILETSPCCCVLALLEDALLRSGLLGLAAAIGSDRCDGMGWPATSFKRRPRTQLPFHGFLGLAQWYKWSQEIWVDEAWKAI